MKCASCGAASDQKQLMRCSRCKDTFYCSVDCQTKDWKSGHKSSCSGSSKKKPSTGRPSARLPSVLLLLSTEQPYPPFFPGWTTIAPLHARLSTITTRRAAVDLLKASAIKFDAIVVQGDAIFTEGEQDSVVTELQNLLVDFTLVKGGRTILLGAWLGIEISQVVFMRRFEVEWEFGLYGRTSFHYNSTFSPLDQGPSPPLTPSAVQHLSRPLTKSTASGADLLHPMLGAAFRSMRHQSTTPAVNTKGMMMQKVAPRDALHIPTPGAISSLGRNPVAQDQVLSAMKKAGQGWFGYFGDVEMNSEGDRDDFGDGRLRDP